MRTSCIRCCHFRFATNTFRTRDDSYSQTEKFRNFKFTFVRALLSRLALYTNVSVPIVPTVDIVAVVAITTIP